MSVHRNLWYEELAGSRKWMDVLLLARRISNRGGDWETYRGAKEELFLDQLVGTTDAPRVAILLPLGRHYCCPF